MKLLTLLEKIKDPKLIYHDELNPKLWEENDGSYELKLVVKKKLIKIAEEFVEALALPESQVKDYVFTGSNANFNWTSLSDIDLHIMVDMKQACEGCKNIDARDCFDAKKSLWNDRHDIKIYGYPVELYASDMQERIVGDAGVYSLLENKWLRLPEKKNVKMNSRTIKAKADDIAQQIDDLIDSKTDDKDVIKELTTKISNYRKAGLAKGGEFSIENLVFKALRNNGYIDKIRKYAVKSQDHTLSLEEALNTDVPLNIISSSKKLFQADAKIGKRRIEFTAMASMNNEDLWNVDFSEDGNDYRLTGSGNEFQVFSFIKKCMETFIEKNHPDTIKFHADKKDKSRAKAYETMLKKFLKGYSIELIDLDDAVIFYLEKK